MNFTNEELLRVQQGLLANRDTELAARVGEELKQRESAVLQRHMHHELGAADLVVVPKHKP